MALSETLVFWLENSLWSHDVVIQFWVKEVSFGTKSSNLILAQIQIQEVASQLFGFSHNNTMQGYRASRQLYNGCN